MLQKIRIPLLALLMAATFSCLNSCKKTDHTSPEKQAETTIPDWVKAEIKKQQGGITYLVNKKSPAIYIDAEGNEVDYSAGKLSKLMDIPCDAEEDDFLDNVFDYKTQTVWYVCGQDLRLTVEYELSTAFTPALVNPANASQVSRGRYRVRDIGGTTIYSNSSITPITITYKGPDAGYPDKSVYKISYTITGLDPTIMTAPIIMENRPIIYTDCPEVITTPGSWEGITTGSVTDACSKIDLISAVTAGGANMVYFGGCDEKINTTGSCYPAAMVAGRPHEHEVQWRKAGDATYGNWPADLPANFNNLTTTSYAQRISWAYPPLQGCTSITNPSYKKQLLQFFDARAYFFPVTGVIELRYRNVKVNTFGNPCSTISCTSDGWLYSTVTVYP